MEELQAFWDDIRLLQDDVFFGTIVLVGKNFTDSSGPFQVIDGQQRLTTFLIIINRIIARFQELGESGLASVLYARLEFTDDNAKKHLVVDNKNAHSYFQKIIFHNENIPENAEALRLIDAKLYFENKLSSFGKDELISLRDKLLKINLIVVVQSDENKAYEVFETLNFRGMDLSILDLVKTFIFKRCPRQLGVDEPREKWKGLLRNIKKDKKNFFNRYWSSRYKKLSDGKLYGEFKKMTKDYSEDHVGLFLVDLVDFSNIYSDVISPSDSSFGKYCLNNLKGTETLKTSVESINKFQVKVHIPFLINILEKAQKGVFTQNKLDQMVDMIEKFHFVFNAVCSRRPSGLDQRYSHYALRINQNDGVDKIISELKNELKNKLPSELEFLEKFSQLNYLDDKGLLLYSFRILEKSKNPGIKVDLVHESLDHLEPKITSNLKDNVGNLVLLERDINSEKKQDKNLFNSIDILKESGYITARETADFVSTKCNGDWNDDCIKKNAERISKEVYNVVVSYFE